MTDRITASCIVNDLGAWQFEVIVTGALTCADHTRTYIIKAMSDDSAAQQGLQKFEDEIQNLRYAGPLSRVN